LLAAALRLAWSASASWRRPALRVAGGNLGLAQGGGELALLLPELGQGLLQVGSSRLAVGGDGLQAVDLRPGIS
jgi:hypothetical protein